MPYKLLDTRKLAEGLLYCLTKEAVITANKIVI